MVKVVGFWDPIGFGVIWMSVFGFRCNTLKSQQQLYGIFVWLVDDSKANGFLYEKQSQELLADPR